MKKTKDPSGPESKPAASTKQASGEPPKPRSVKPKTAATVEAQRVAATAPEGRLYSLPSAEAIARLAYDKFCERGYQHGWDREDWLAAEQELIAKARGGEPMGGTQLRAGRRS